MLAEPAFQWEYVGRCIHCGEAFYQQGERFYVKWSPECDHELEGKRKEVGDV